MKTKLIFLALSIFFISWFSIITPSSRFPDPDAFYHITAAKLISEQGPLVDFPWLDLTTLGSHFADQHFLFHVLQIPFLKISDPLAASRISSIFFAALCLLGISFVFYKLKIKLWWLWPIFLTLTQPFTTRLIQGKASPLAILFWFVGVGTVLYILRSGVGREPCVRPVLTPTAELNNSNQSTGDHKDTPLRCVFAIRYPLFAISIVSFLFTLTHGGWILLPVSIILIILGDLISKKIIKKTISQHLLNKEDGRIYQITARYLSPFFASISGCLIGLLAHPNRSEIFSFLKVQLFDVAVATPRILRLGTEWNASNIENIISMFGVFGIIILLISLSHILTDNKTKKDVELEAFGTRRMIVILLPLLVLLFAASIKNLRFTEYFQPILALITAYFSQTINWKDLFNKLKLQDTRYKILDTLVPFVIIFAMAMIIVQHIVSAYSATHYAKRFFANQYQIPMDAITEIAKPGDRVYNSMWDEFPILFFHNQNLRYISGLDPTFLYKSSSTLALDYQDLVFNSSSTQEEAYSLIHDRLQSDFILIDNERWPHLADIIASDHRYTFLAEGDGGVAYKVEE